MNIITSILLIYIMQILICCMINIINGEKEPSNTKEYLKLTFLPTLLWKIYKENRELY